MAEAIDQDAGGATGTQNGAAAKDSATEVAELRTALSQAQERLEQQKDQYLRAAAELDNVRKRAQRDIESAHRYALERFAIDLLPVRDSLELGVRNGANSDAASLVAGQQATLKLLDKAFERFSIKQVEAAGQRFDPSRHEAMLMQPSAGAAPNTVLQVVQSGYELNGRLLRPARVVVAAASATGDGQGQGAASS
jgi:molecular chaperone GrpE